MNRSTDAAIHRLEAMLPTGVVIEEFTGSTSWGSRDRDGQYKPNVGSYRRHGTGWCVETAAEGWENERERYFQWGSTIREACLKLAWSFRRVQRDPHLQHLGLEGPGDVTFEGYFVHGCEACERDANLFNGDVEWEEAG